MSLTCPQGHLSAADDYCDTCGAPMNAASPTASVPASPSAPAAPAAARVSPGATPPAEAVEAADAQTCPNCGTANPADNLFCEGCGFDFTTGVMPRPIPLAEGSFLDLDAPAPRAQTPPTDSDSDSGPDSESDSGAPAGAPDATPDDVAGTESPATQEKAVPDPTPEPAPRPAPTPEPTAAPEPAAEPAPPAPAVPDTAPEPAPPGPSAPGPAPAPTPPAPGASSPSARRPTFTPPSRELEASWVVEVWIDPEWHEVQSTGDPCPSPMVPDVVRLDSTTALIGRPSSSRNVRPDIDCGSDTGVSRRHAQLASDGRRWWVEDLGSANGTFVGPASGPLPTTPLEAGRRAEVDADDRIYVGAWTRLVVRRATESEKAGLG
ncbi:FHA domain-containing protein [Agilicoccus flavus]|uniref:FHA domain-containing protein n=1 Tax=Agilicoccus flavus TaxID=2775968 RepID=UPI001CF66369|nr:FHA domain-containing protein [Agilicoccus flavus]